MLQRKVLAGIVLICLAVIGGCGKQEEAYMEQEDYTTIHWFSDVSFWEPPAWTTEKGTITGDISAKTGIKAEVEIPAQEADTQLKLKILHDELPDVISITDASTIQYLVASGKVWTIDEFFETYKPDSHLLKRFPEDIKQELIKRDGGWYALPSHMNSADAREIWKAKRKYWDDIANYSDNNVIMWNRDLLEQLGLKAADLETEDAVLDALEKAKESGMIPLFLDGNMYQDSSLKILLATFGAEWVDDEGNYTDIYLQPEAKDTLKFVNTCIRRGYLQAEELAYENVQMKELLSSEDVLCFIGNVANTSTNEREWISSGAILSSNGKQPVFGKQMRASTGWMQTFISKDCTDPEKIAAWIDYMTSDEGMLLCLYGYEGKDYTIGADGTFYRTKEREHATDDYSATGLGAWWPFENNAWRRSVASENEHYGEIKMAYARNPKTVRYDDSLLLFPADVLPVGSEEGQLEQKLENFKEQQILVTILAATDAQFEAEYEKLIQGLYDEGIEKIDQIKNEAYQANCKEYQNEIKRVNYTNE